MTYEEDYIKSINCQANFLIVLLLIIVELASIKEYSKTSFIGFLILALAIPIIFVLYLIFYYIMCGVK